MILYTVWEESEEIIILQFILRSYRDAAAKRKQQTATPFEKNTISTLKRTCVKLARRPKLFSGCVYLQKNDCCCQERMRPIKVVLPSLYIYLQLPCSAIKPTYLPRNSKDNNTSPCFGIEWYVVLHMYIFKRHLCSQEDRLQSAALTYWSLSGHHQRCTLQTLSKRCKNRFTMGKNGYSKKSAWSILNYPLQKISCGISLYLCECERGMHGPVGEAVCHMPISKDWALCLMNYLKNI